MRLRLLLLSMQRRCLKVGRDGNRVRSRQAPPHAEALEERVWGVISGPLREPERLCAGLDAMIEEEKASGCTAAPKPRQRCGSTSSPK